MEGGFFVGGGGDWVCFGSLGVVRGIWSLFGCVGGWCGWVVEGGGVWVCVL